MTNSVRSIRRGPTSPARVLLFLPGYGDRPEPFLERARAFDPDGRWMTIVIEPQRSNDHGPHWYDVDENGPDPIALAEAIASVDATCAAVLTEFGLTESELVIAGFSQGGALALAHFLDPSSKVAPFAVAALSSYLPSREAPCIDLGRAQDHPVLFAHGEDDELVEPLRGRSAAKALHRANALVTWSEVPGGHRFESPVIEPFSRWLDALERGERPVAPPI